MKLYVEEYGSATEPSIVFIHGAVVAGWMWHLQVKDLARDYHCIVPDLPGHGQSPNVEPFSLVDTTEQLADLIRSRANGGKAHVVGLSLGGALTLRLLAQHPELVDHAIISGPAGGPLPGYMVQFTRFFLPLSRREFMLRLNARYLRIPDNLYNTFKESQLRFTDSTYMGVMGAVDSSRIPAGLGDVHVPLLAVVGTREPATMRRVAREAVSMMPNATGRAAPKGSHGWNSENPDLFNRMVRAWITDTPLPDELLPLN